MINSFAYGDLEGKVAASITFAKVPEKCYVFSASDEEQISDFLYQKLGERMCENSFIPAYIEASGWCALASVGEVYSDSEFEIEIVQL